MKIVAFLQNQWFRDPERIRQMFADRPDHRLQLIKRFLFRSFTGVRLRGAFGPELCDQIIWEEASPEIGGESGSVFPPDPEHMLRIIEEHAPGIILTFGRVAADGMLAANRLATERRDIRLIAGPHPAARANDTVQRLARMNEAVRAALVSGGAA